MFTQFPLCFPMKAHKAPREGPSGSPARSMKHYEKESKFGDLLFQQEVNTPFLLSWRVRLPCPQGFSLQTQPRQTSVWTLHCWQTHCIELNGSPPKDISTSQSLKSVDNTLYRLRGFEPEGFEGCLQEDVGRNMNIKATCSEGSQKEMRSVLLETGKE